MEGLLATYLEILAQWSLNFQQRRSYLRALALAVSLCLTLGRKTLTRMLGAAGLEQDDWTAAYRLFSRRLWSPRVLFRPIMNHVPNLLANAPLIAVGYDDTLIRKTGKRIKDSSWQRDPLSPPFRVNFVWGMRYLQASLLVPLYESEPQLPPRALPLQFEQLPKFKKPSKKAGAEQWQHYRDLTKKHNVSTCFVRELRYLRRELDQLGLHDKSLLAVCDGSFCNRTCFTANVPRTDIIARARKNARLYRRHEGDEKQRGRKRFYESKGFTPEQVRVDTTLDFESTRIFYGGDWRVVRFKDLKEVYWKWGTKRLPLRLLVLAPTPYRRDGRGKLRYRQSAYLLTTDLVSPPKLLIQKYFDRWQLEVNFKEEKDIMGLGQQQVWSLRAIPRLPAFIAASYSALLLASIVRFNDYRDPQVFIERPKWRGADEIGRPSCLDLLALMRREALDQREHLDFIGIKPSERSMIITSAA